MKINSLYIETPLGTMIACSTEHGICLLEFTDRKEYDAQIDRLTKALGKPIDKEGSNVHLDLLKKELAEYFSGNRKAFSVSLDMVGTEFQKEVWNELLNIPYGKTASYLQQALAMNKPESVRAVANANGMNKIAIIIPCHRVIGSNGKLTGYAGGLERKKWLLNLENQEKDLFS